MLPQRYSILQNDYLIYCNISKVCCTFNFCWTRKYTLLCWIGSGLGCYINFHIFLVTHHYWLNKKFHVFLIFHSYLSLLSTDSAMYSSIFHAMESSDPPTFQQIHDFLQYESWDSQDWLVFVFVSISWYCKIINLVTSKIKLNKLMNTKWNAKLNSF